MIFESTLPARNHPDVSVYQLVYEGSKKIDEEKLCFVDAEDQSQAITFGQMKNLVLRFGAGLKRVFPDFAQGDTVAIYSPNNIHYAVVLHGVVAVGGSVASVDRTSDVETTVSCLQNVDAKIIIAHSETLDKAISAAKVAGIPTENVFILGKKDIDGTRCVENAFLNHDELAVPVTYTREELFNTICYYYFTSGTTGKKKTVPYTHKNIVSACTTKDEWVPPHTKMLSHTEPYHASCLCVTLHMNAMHGVTTYLLKEYTFEKLLLAIQECNINGLVTHPWIAASFVKEPIADKYDLSSFEFLICGGSAVDKNMCKSFYKRFGIPAIGGFGMTEILNTFRSGFQYTVAGAVGILAPGFTCKLVDEDGKELGYNEPGELLIKGPTLTPGYHKNPEANAEVFDKDGFYRSRDLFKVDENGVFTYLDRITDLIRYKETAIVPQEIESILMSHPLVSDCAAIGVHSEEESCWIPRAFIMLTKYEGDVEKVRKEVLEIAETQLPNVAQLRGGLYIVKELPRNSAGKINRRALRQYNIEKCL